jgi:hypothetical protein
MKPPDVIAKPGREAQVRRSEAAVFSLLITVLSCCSPVPAGSGPPPDDDGGSDSETGSGTNTESDTDSATTEDQLPGWHLEWAEQIGSSGQDMLLSLARCDTESFVATGWFSGEVSFGGVAMSGAAGHMFLVKMNLGGKVEWATWAGHGYTNGLGIAHSAETGRIAVSGYFGNDAVFGSGETNETWLHEDANGDAGFLAVYEEGGELAWAAELAPVGESLSGANGDGVTFFPDGSVLVTGWFAGEMTLGQDLALSSPDEISAFVARFDPDGEPVWARRIGGQGRTESYGLAVLPNDSFALLGTYRGTALLGEGEPGETALQTLGEESSFLARFDGNGDLCWAVDLGIDAFVSSFSSFGRLLLLANGDIALTGQFTGGSMLAGDGESLSPVEAPDQGLFLARYTTEGANIWTRVATVGSNYSLLEGVAELGDGTLVAAGRFSGTATFTGPDQETCQLQADDLGDGLLAAWSADGSFLWALRQGGNHGEELLRGVAAFPGTGDDIDVLVVGGFFCHDVLWGTGGDDLAPLTAAGDYDQGDDIVLLRFDREAE